METIIGLLSQIAPLALTETTLYSVPAKGHALIEEIAVCNRVPAAASFRISISQLGAPTAVTDYLYFDMPLSGNDTFTTELHLTLNPSDIIRIYASSATLTFALLGQRT